jgi:hypothetical protein
MSSLRSFHAGLGSLYNNSTEPLFWFDTNYGMSADLSTWKARVGNYTAVQPDASKRFTRVNDSRPKWLQTTLSTGMIIPSVNLGDGQELTVIVAAEVNEPWQRTAQPIITGPDIQLYTFSNNIEFFVSDGGSSGSNPTVVFPGYTYQVAGGDAKVGRYPSSRSFLEGKYNTTTNRDAGRTTALRNGDWTIGAHAGRIRHILAFKTVLTSDRNTYWTQLLHNTTF